MLPERDWPQNLPVFSQVFNFTALSIEDRVKGE